MKERFQVVDHSKGYDGTFDCCMVRDNLHQGRVLFCHNQPGEWGVMNHKDIDEISTMELCQFLEKRGGLESEPGI